MPETIAKVTRYVANDNGLKEANQRVHGRRTLRVGVHAHDDRKRAVDNTFRAIEAGATHAHGTFNGGERLGNADLLAFLGTLRENYGIEVVPVDILAQWKEQSERLLQLCGLPPDPRRPFVGDVACATKAGLHASGSRRHRRAYASYKPNDYGLQERTLISELIGKDGIVTRLEQLGLPYVISAAFEKRLTSAVKANIVDGHHDYVAGEASFFVLALRMHEQYRAPFRADICGAEGRLEADVRIDARRSGAASHYIELDEYIELLELPGEPPGNRKSVTTRVTGDRD